jgi:phage gp36-like protein
MFITDQDYKVVIGDQALKVISQVSQQNRNNAETEAIEEISGYLRPKYDVEEIFSVGDGSAAAMEGRNRLIVMYTCDIALYHMAASLPQKMGIEIRRERYERAIKWLEGVQAGKIVPDLPLAIDEDGNPVGFPMVYGCQKKLRHNW